MFKKIFLGVFATVLAFTAIAGSLTLSSPGTVTASADVVGADTLSDIVNENFGITPGVDCNDSDGNYKFIDGISAKLPDANKLRWGLQIDNPLIEKIEKNHTYEFVFDLLKLPEDEGQKLVTRYYYLIADNVYFVFKRNYSYDIEVLTIDGFRTDGNKTKNDQYEILVNAYSPYGYEIVDYGSFAEDGLVGESVLSWTEDKGAPTVHFITDLESKFMNYKVRFGYRETRKETYTETTGILWWKKTVTRTREVEVRKGAIDSISGSARQIAASAVASGEYPEIEYPILYEVANMSSKRDITVIMLEQIGSSPFARKVGKGVTIYTVNDEVSLDDVAHALNVDYLSCLESLPLKLQKTSANTYEVVYAKAVWINASTVDGNSANYFLDINQSFEDFYRPYVDEEVIPEDMYSWFFNEVKSLCPSEVGNYEPDEIYGFWGFLAIPYTYSLNQLWAEFFGNKTEYAGVTHHFKYNDRISQTAYNKLLTEFNYGWTGHIWNSICTWVDNDENASFFLFYNENGQDGVISNSGSLDPEDDDGLMQNKGEEIVDDITNGINNIANNIANEIKTLGAKLQSPLGVVILIAILGVIGYILYLKFFNRRK